MSGGALLLLGATLGARVPGGEDALRRDLWDWIFGPAPFPSVERVPDESQLTVYIYRLPRVFHADVLRAWSDLRGD